MSLNRDEAFAQMVDSCPSFAAAGGFARYASSFEEADEPDAYVRMVAFAHHVVDLVERREMEEVGWVLGAVERVLAEGDEEAADLVVLGFLEPLRNIVSHDDIGVAAAELATVLGPDASEAWTENEDLWEAAARWRHGGARVGGADYAGVTHPELRRYLQAHKRRMADGVLLGASDVVSYQRQVQGISPILPAGVGRVPWAAVIVGLVLAAAVLSVLVR
jgi:hypothetical protein